MMGAEGPDIPGLAMRRRNLPHWELGGSIYFLTFRIKDGYLSDDEIILVREYVKRGDPEFYTLLAATVMPDHVNMIICPKPGVSLARITKGVKGGTARLINDRRGERGALWQDESYDRIIRDEKELAEKMQYVFLNAVRKGLCEDGWDNIGFYCKEN